jgi:hypothetical protein
VVHIEAAAALQPGQFVKVKLLEAVEYDFMGEIVGLGGDATKK